MGNAEYMGESHMRMNCFHKNLLVLCISQLLFIGILSLPSENESENEIGVFEPSVSQENVQKLKASRWGFLDDEDANGSGDNDSFNPISDDSDWDDIDDTDDSTTVSTRQ